MKIPAMVDQSAKKKFSKRRVECDAFTISPRMSVHVINSKDHRASSKSRYRRHNSSDSTTSSTMTSSSSMTSASRTSESSSSEGSLSCDSRNRRRGRRKDYCKDKKTARNGHGDSRRIGDSVGDRHHETRSYRTSAVGSSTFKHKALTLREEDQSKATKKRKPAQSRKRSSSDSVSDFSVSPKRHSLRGPQTGKRTDTGSKLATSVTSTDGSRTDRGKSGSKTSKTRHSDDRVKAVGRHRDRPDDRHLSGGGGGGGVQREQKQRHRSSSSSCSGRRISRNRGCRRRRSWRSPRDHRDRRRQSDRFGQKFSRVGCRASSNNRRQPYEPDMSRQRRRTRRSRSNSIQQKRIQEETMQKLAEMASEGNFDLGKVSVTEIMKTIVVPRELRTNQQQAMRYQMSKLTERIESLTGVKVPSFYTTGAVNPLTYADQMRKRKLLWSGKKADTTTAKVGMAMTDGRDEKTTEKFRKLMGMKDQCSASADYDEIIRKQAEAFDHLDREYALARLATHTHRGTGLGFLAATGAAYGASDSHRPADCQ